MRTIMEWQPIETAPMDGTRVIVHCPDETPSVFEARFAYDCWCDPVYYEWFSDGATHWMPLPQPPEEL